MKKLFLLTMAVTMIGLSYTNITANDQVSIVAVYADNDDQYVIAY